LTRLLDGFATILRKDQRGKYKASSVITQTRKFSALRFAPHRIALEAPILEKGEHDFEAVMSFGLVVSALNNLVDNAIYWLKVRWPEVPPPSEKPLRKLFLGVSDDFEEGPAIIVADNGPGFVDSPERLVTPFFTRKPSGMGLGLYYANMVMELNGGSLRFPKKEDLDLPDAYDGAIVALVFRKVQ
jgi:signal transduction histidine kinase